jgi:hypothetical protein
MVHAMIRRCLALLVVLLAAPFPASAKDPPPPPVDTEHVHPSGALTFRTPASWTVEDVPSVPGAVQTKGDGLIVRFVYRKGDVGYDTLHVDCMAERLTGPFDVSPEIKYEYDFLSATVGEMRILDSAFVTKYDAPIDGQIEWRQRNLTITGGGHSLCAIAFAPLKVWKKSKSAKLIVEQVVMSATFR